MQVLLKVSRYKYTFTKIMLEVFMIELEDGKPFEVAE